MTITWNNDPIVTEHVYPPIPIRTLDWQAMLQRDRDNLCGCGECRKPPTGEGHSERQAICDLVERLMEE